MVFKQVGNDTDSLINKFGLLNKSFANIKKDFQNGQGLRSFSNIVSKQDIANFDKFQQDLQRGVSYHKAFNNNLANSHTYIQQQAVRLRELNVQQKLLGRQLKTNKITQEEYRTAMSANQAQVKALTTKTQTLTFAQKASAVASKVMGTALKVALNVGFMVAINLIITGITKLVNKQKELREAANESAEKLDNQVEAIKNLKTEYLAIIDSDKTSIEKTEELNTWKQTLIDTYGDEYEALQTLNDERERGVEILNAEIQKTARAARDEWIGTNDKAIEKAVEKYYDVDSRIGSIQGKYMSTTIDIPKSVQELLNIDYQHTHGATYFNFGIDAENIEEQYDKIGQAIKILSDKKQRLGELNEYEQQLLDLLNKKYSKVGKTIEENSSIYDKYFKSVAQNKFEDYVATADGDIENVGKDTYLAWKNGLLKTAENNSKGVQDELTALIEQQFPDYEKYFDNLDKAREQFGVTAPNSADEAKKRAFIDTLSPEDLEIATQIPDLFADGLDGATAKIEAWKADPNNKITPDVDTNPLEELQEAYDELSKSAISYVSNQKTLNSALEEQKEYGQLSAKTIQELTDAGYAEALVVDNETGAVTLNKQAYEQLNEQKKQKIKLDLIAEKSTLEDKLRDEQKAVSDLTQEYESLANANSQLFAGRLLEITDELAKRGESISAISELIDKINGSISSLDAPTFEDGKKEEKPQSVLDFEAEYARRQHEINMGRMKEDEDYYNWLESAAKTAFEGLEDYQDDLWKYEEEVYKGRKQLAEDYYDELQKLFEDEISGYETQIEVTTKDSTDADGNKLDIEGKYDYISSLYQTIINRINSRIGEILDAGIEGHEEEVAKLEKQIEEFQDKLAEVPKDAAKEEQDYIKKLKDDYEDLYDERIKQIKDEQKAAEEAAQAEIDAVQEKIDTLKKVNEEQQTALDIEKARQDLEKASQKTRVVYGSDGSITYQADKEKVNEAKEKLDKLLFEQQVKILEDQKDLLESAKDKQSEAYDAIINNLETEKENGEKRFDILLQVLDEYLNPNQGESNSDVWSMLAKIEGAKYENGVWSDKDGNVIDINELIKSAETKTDDKKPETATDTKADNSKSETKDNGTTTLSMERKSYSPDKIENEVKDKTETAIDGLFRNLEKQFGLKSGSLNLEKAYQIYSNSPMMNFDPYSAMKERSGLANKEYVSNVNNNNNASNVTVGDIHIHNPVGDSNDLAKELQANLHNAADKIIYSNLK